MRISVFGLGYVGCVTAACLARDRHHVVGIDVDDDKVQAVAAGRSPIVEPGLEELIAKVVGSSRLSATSSIERAVEGSDVAMICVGTPGQRNGAIELGAIERVGAAIGGALRGRKRPFTVVLRSTVLPGTTERVLVPAIRRAGGSELSATVEIGVNPEFIREGSALSDFASPPFTLVGCGHSPEAERTLRVIYWDVQARFLCTSIRTAEMVKYASNAFHAVKVCFANEIGDVAEAMGVDPEEVMQVFLQDRKLNVSEAYLRPGFAFGGSCLPKDLRALLQAARTADVALPLLESAFRSNELQIRNAVRLILESGSRRIAVVGLSFKPGTDDLRESPLVSLVESLIGKGCELRILDRNVSLARLRGANRRYIEEEIPHIASLMCDSEEELLADAEVVVIGNRSDEALRILEAAGPDRIVLDLTRRGVDRHAAAHTRSLVR